MKKFIGVLLTVILCMSLTVPAAFASAEEALTGGIADLIGGFISGESSLDSLDLDNLTGIVGSFMQEEKDNEETDTQVKLEQGFQDAMDKIAENLPGGATIDFSWLTSTLSEGVDTAAVEKAVSEISADEMPGLLTVIADAFSGAGIDMTTFDISELGKFDITTLLGGAETSAPTGTATDVAPNDSSMITTDLVTGILDTLRGGLTTVGIDTDALLGSLGDNELINFFANMYIGFVGPVADDKPAEEGEKEPETGDTASVVVALATLCVATATAGVCLKKKED